MKSSTNVKNGSRRQRGRNIAICCDGTALSEKHHFGQSLTPSNITKIYNLIDVEPPKVTAAKSKRQQQWRGKGVSGSDYLVNCSSEDEDEDEDYREQIAFYERGIATKGGTIRKSLEGLTGAFYLSCIFFLPYADVDCCDFCFFQFSLQRWHLICICGALLYLTLQKISWLSLTI